MSGKGGQNGGTIRGVNSRHITKNWEEVKREEKEENAM